MPARSHQRLWSGGEEAALLLIATLRRPGDLADFARRSHRSPVSVRVKLCRLLKKPENRPPSIDAAPTDAAAPRVPTARGPEDTTDSQR